MKMLRLGLPLVVALFALAGAATTAFAAGHPSGAALTPAAGSAQEADEANIEAADRATRGDVAVRPDRGDSKHRIATLCYRLHNSDRVATVLRARCAEIFGEALPDPAALCRLLIERGADEQAVRNCIDRMTDDLSPAELCRRAINGELDGDRVSDLLERCREHIGDATDHNPAELCRRAINGELDGDRVSDLLERCREHFGDATDLSPAELRRRAIAGELNHELEGDRVSNLLERCREHFGDAPGDRRGDVCRKAIDSDSNRDVASILARCRDHVGQDRPHRDQVRDGRTDRPQHADANRARLAQAQ